MFTFGFYNSKNGDRLYNATHFGKLFDGIITDGIFGSIYKQFNVTPDSVSNPENPTIIVQSGAAWYGRTWNILDSDTIYEIDTVAANKKRTDAICIDVNETDKSDETNNPSRTNKISIVKGQVYNLSDPVVLPTTIYQRNALNNDVIRCQFPIAYVTIYGSGYRDNNNNQYEANIIKDINIQNVVNSSTDEETKYKKWQPLVTGATMNVDVSSLIPTVEEYLNSLTALRTNQLALFNEWFYAMKDQLTSDAAGALQTEIDELITYGTEVPTELPEGQLYFQIEE